MGVVNAGRTIVGTYTEPKAVIVGEQIGRRGKDPEDPLLSIEWTYAEISGNLKVKVFREQD